MFSKIIKGYKNLFLSLAKIILLLLLCALCGAVLVFPLWKLAVSKPELYSVIVGVLLCLGICYMIFRKTRKYITQGQPEKEERKDRVRRILVLTGKILVCLLGISALFVSVLAGQIVAAVVSVLLTALLYGILAFGINTTRTTSDES